MYYKLKSQGLAPRTHSVGDKQLIGPDADRECLAAREAEAAAERVAKRDGTSGKAA
jgi:hypothetical protein